MPSALFSCLDVMNTRRLIAFFLLTVLVVAVAVWRLLPSGKAGQAAVIPPVVVEVAPVALRDFAQEISAVGSLSSNESVTLRPETSGRIEKIGFADGQEVQKGTLLIQLDDAVQAAEAMQARANLRLAQATKKRYQDLFEKHYISHQELDNVLATSSVRQAELQLAEARLAKTRIVAPFSGVVGLRNVSVGKYAQEGDELVHLEDISQLKVDFRVPESQLSKLKKGQRLEVRADALGGEKLEAELIAIDPLLEAGGRSIACRAMLDNADRHLRPGMFVRVRLLFGTRRNVPALPEEALVTGEKPMVFVVRKDPEGTLRAHAVAVLPGARQDGFLEISGDDLKPGEPVVVAGQLKIRDGQAVEVSSPQMADPLSTIRPAA
jgi:membrane fusion protein (multidrug efflux system)